MFDVTAVVKTMMINNDYTMTRLAKELSERMGKEYSVAGLSYRIKQKALHMSEFVVICDIFGYELKVKSQSKEENVWGL